MLADCPDAKTNCRTANAKKDMQSQMNSIEEIVNYAYDCLYHQNMATISDPVCEMRKKIEHGGDNKGRENNDSPMY